MILIYSLVMDLKHAKFVLMKILWNIKPCEK